MIENSQIPRNASVIENSAGEVKGNQAEPAGLPRVASHTDGDTTVQMFVDLVDLWERAALDGTPVEDITGEDPVEFAESFAQAYGGKRWIDKERAKLISEIDEAKRVTGNDLSE